MYAWYPINKSLQYLRNQCTKKKMSPNYSNSLKIKALLCSNFTLLSQRNICFLSVIDAESQEGGVETTVNCKLVTPEKILSSPKIPQIGKVQFRKGGSVRKSWMRHSCTFLVNNQETFVLKGCEKQHRCLNFSFTLALCQNE